MRAREDTLVLCYHAVSTSWDAPLSVTPGQLDAQLSHLSARGYRAVTFAEALGGAASGRRVAITFDDGYRSVLRLAQPVLEAHGMAAATLFVPTDFIGIEQPMSWPGIDRWLRGPHAAELVPISWDEAGQLAAAGWEIGSHTCSHPRLTELDDERLRTQLEDSRAECEQRLRRPCESLAFPYGAFDRRVSEAARAAGYAGAAALAAGPGRPSRHCWPRVGVYHVDGDRSFRMKVSPAARRLRRSRGWAALDPLLRVVRPPGYAEP
jgi:peptidoglycan/xylan/chitin deacetylase (PgdA/CDA1 family)